MGIIHPLDYLTGAGRNIDTHSVMSTNFAIGSINTCLLFVRPNKA